MTGYPHEIPLLWDTLKCQRVKSVYKCLVSCRLLLILMLKVTRYLCFKNGKNLQLLDVQVCNSANKAAFQNPTKSLFAQWSIDALFTSMEHWAKRLFVGF